MDNGPESPSWLPAASAVGTGADPPAADQETESGHDEHPYPADVGADRDTTAAPGFSDAPPSEFGDAHASDPEFGEDAGFAEDPADDQGLEAHAGPAGFAEAPAAGPGFVVAPATDTFAAPGPAGYSVRPEHGQGFENQGFENQGFDDPGFENAAPSNGQQGEYAGEYHQGEFAGAYPGGGFGAAQPGGPFVGAAPGYGPAAGTGYSGQENGTATREPPPVPGHYPPVEQARSKFSAASLWGFRRGKASKRARPGRQAQLTVARVEPWSVMKFSFVISLVAFIVLFVAVAVLYAVLSGLGVFSALQRTIESITSSQSSSGFNLSHYLSASRVLGYTGLLGAVNVVLITAISTVGSVLYNITADLAGGVEVTLKETDGS